MSPRLEPPFDLLTLRGEFLVIDRNQTPAAILYASRSARNTDALLTATTRAYQRGQEERELGWPEVLTSRTPIFSITADPEGPGFVVWEHHPRISIGDRVLYQTLSEVDASMALDAVRHAATLGALGVEEV